MPIYNVYKRFFIFIFIYFFNSFIYFAKKYAGFFNNDDFRSKRACISIINCSVCRKSQHGCTSFRFTSRTSFPDWDPDVSWNLPAEIETDSIISKLQYNFNILISTDIIKIIFIYLKGINFIPGISNFLRSLDFRAKKIV